MPMCGAIWGPLTDEIVDSLRGNGIRAWSKDTLGYVDTSRKQRQGQCTKKKENKLDRLREEQQYESAGF